MTAPASAVPSVPLASVDPGDQAAVWSAVMERIADRRALMWVHGFEVTAWEKGHATLAPRPGRREAASFATPQRLALLEAELQAVTGQPIRVTAEQPCAKPAPMPSRGSTDEAQRQALDLPLVRCVFEVFPDATLMGVEPIDDKPPPDPADPA